MNLLSSLLAYTARQIAALRAKDTSQDAEITGAKGRLDTAESQISTLNSRIETAISGATTSTEVTDIRVGADGVTYSTAGTSVRTQLTNLKSDLSKISDFQGDLSKYLYKKNTYINASGVETALNGYDLYKFPVKKGDVITLMWDKSAPFWNALNAGYVFKYHANDAFSSLSIGTEQITYCISSIQGTAMFIPSDAEDALYICVDATRVSSILFAFNYPYDRITNEDIVTKSLFPYRVTADTACKSLNYTNYSNEKIYNFASPYYTLTLPVKTGDVIEFSSLITGLSYYGTFRGNDGTASQINSAVFTVPKNGFVHIFGHSDYSENATFIDANAIIIPEDTKPLDGKIITFFGDSITYRYEWEPYVLAELGGIGNNCGIGSTSLSGDETYAFWKDVRINAVKATNPDILTIMGGANDLVNNPHIGTETNLADKDTSTFIGAYSYIIDTLLTWKPSLKIVIIGTSYAHNDGADYSDTVTYGDFANACKLVADYYHLPYVDLYNESGFNKYTMNSSPYNIYSADHIHPNGAGAKIIASMVIQKLREVFGIA